MTKIVNTADPPPEVVNLLRSVGLPRNSIDGWFAVPTFKSPNRHLSTDYFATEGSVDAFELIKPLLGNRILNGTLRTMDFMDGCRNLCDVCLAGAVHPSKMFSYQSIRRLFHNRQFLRMLQPDSLRFGSSGDILNHPQAIEIILLALKQTRFLDRARRQRTKGTKRHIVRIYTNYRPGNEDKLDQLLALAIIFPHRLRITISLPLNKTDVVNDKFIEYARLRGIIFGKIKMNGSCFAYTNFKNIHIQDVRHPRMLFNSGRTLSEKYLRGRVEDYDYCEADRESNYSQRGFVKTYFNPAALWLMIYTTMKESHTVRTFTPLNTQNLEVLSLLPYHPDFPTPPNWPGGSHEERSERRARYLKRVNRHRPSKRVRKHK